MRAQMKRFRQIALIGTVLLILGSTSGVSAAVTQITRAGARTELTPAVNPSGQPPWSIVPTSAPDGTLFFGSTCADAWDCWSVGGIFQNGGNSFAGVTQYWNGSSWSTVPTAVPAGHNWIFTGISCIERDNCWAVGGLPRNGVAPSPFAEHWNGSVWSFVNSPAVNGYFLGVSCFGPTSCWATGPRADVNGNTTGSLVEHWDGTSWNIVRTADTGQPYGGLNSIACTGPSECWAVGWAGPNTQNTNFLPVFPAEAAGKGVIERWNGSSWSIVSSPQSSEGTYLSSVACPASSDCWAVGSLTNSAGFARSALLEHWDGKSWTSTSLSSLSGSGGDFLRQIDCVNSSDCVAVGASGLLAGFKKGIVPAAAGWNGSAWSSVSTTQPSAYIAMLAGVSCAGRSECFATGFEVNPSGSNVVINGMVQRLQLPKGYSLAGSDGGVFSFGSARFNGSMGGRALAAPIDGTSTPDGDGYWLTGSDGGVFAFRAPFAGSEAGKHLSAPIIGIATAGIGGYWLAGSDGGVFSFGDAMFHGSMAARRLVAPVVAVTTADIGGYWLAGSDGGVFSFGDAKFHGSMGGKHLSAPMVAMANTPDGGGYWLVGSDGGVFSFGDAKFHGSMVSKHLTARIVGIVATPDGGGYWLVGSDGGVYSFGDAMYQGSEGGVALAAPVVAGA